jgi:hypothetical protein
MHETLPEQDISTYPPPQTHSLLISQAVSKIGPGPVVGTASERTVAVATIGDDDAAEAAVTAALEGRPAAGSKAQVAAQTNVRATATRSSNVFGRCIITSVLFMHHILQTRPSQLRVYRNDRWT